MAQYHDVNDWQTAISLLRRLKAVEDPRGRAQLGTPVFYIPASKQWVAVSSAGGGRYRLSWHGNCPCDR